MATEVKLPRLGQGMESGTIVKWLKGEGEPVKKREPLYELDTDKVTQEVEAEADGVLLKIVVDSGEVEVGKTIAFIGDEGEEVSSENGKAPAAEADRTKPPSRSRTRPRPKARRRRGWTTSASAARRPLLRRPPPRPPPSPTLRRGRTAASRPRRSHAGSRARRGSTSRRSPAAAPRAGSSPRTSSGAQSRRRRPLRRPRPPSRRRGRGDRAHLDPEDDRAPADRGVAGAGLPADRLGRHDPLARAARAARRPAARRRDEADRQRPADEGRRGRAPAPPGRQRALHRRQDPPLPVTLTSGSRSRRRTGSSSR